MQPTSPSATANIYGLVSPSGGGKSSLIFAFLQEHNHLFELSISHTTRAPRSGEQLGKHYYFCDAGDFRRRIAKGDFVEWALVHGHYYGTTATELERIHAGHKSVILDIDIQGWIQLKNKIPSAEALFVLPPSFAEMRRRLKGRGSESPESLGRRYRSCLKEIAQMEQCQWFMINDEFASSLEMLRRWMVDHQPAFHSREQALQVGRQISRDLENSLEQRA